MQKMIKASTKKKSPLKIETKNKSYSLVDSPLNNLTTKKKLENILGFSFKDLSALANDSHYHIFPQEKDGKERQIQQPMFSLEVIHTKIASLLSRIIVPDYIHSGIKRKSYITNAKVHINSEELFTIDIRKYYQSITKKSIYNFFYSTLNAAPEVAGLLASLCSYNTHLPTGSRLSMPLAYWVNHKMFSDLNQLCARKFINMSVFVDDLTFSGVKVNEQVIYYIKEIIKNAGFEIHPNKTRFYKKNQPKLVTGVILAKDGMKVRNKHQKAINDLKNEIRKKPRNQSTTQKELIGRLHAASQIEPIFKRQAQQLNFMQK